MAATFDEAIGHQSGMRLVLDGVLSLARQWCKTLDGSDQALEPMFPDRSPDLEVYRQRSIAAHSRAWRINFAWGAGLLLAFALSADWPLTISRAPWLLAPVVIGLLLLLRKSPGWMDGPLESMTALSIREDPRIAQLIVYRERLRKWSTSFILLLAMQSGAHQALNLLRGYRMLEPDEKLIRITLLAAIGIFWLVVMPLFLRRINENASNVLQAEIDAIRNAQQPQHSRS
jgi:hypothetical protein